MAWLETVVTAAPAIEPLTLTQVKAQCRIEGVTTDDDLLNGYISSARQHVEAYCGIRLITQTVQLRCASFDDFGLLPAAPLQSLSGITYLDTSGASQTLDPALYSALLYGLAPKIRFDPTKTLPGLFMADDAITVTATAGYGAATEVPQPIIQAMLLLIGQWYDYRQDFVMERGSFANLPNAVAALLANYRR